MSPEFGPAWLVLFLLSVGGNFSNDLVSLVDADGYLKAHNIEVKADALVELAGKQPEDPKDQVAQLLALRWLGEHPDQANQVKDARATVRQIADGKKAQDRLGFARDYARTTLALLDGKPAPGPAVIPAQSVAREALQWCPGSATIFGAYDLRASGTVAPADKGRLRSLALKTMAGLWKKAKLYSVVDGTGNMRLDRVSLAYAADPKDNRKSRMYVRFTGLGDPKLLTDLIKKGLPGAKVEVKKGPKGRPMTVISSAKRAPAFALVGDTDLLMCGYESDEKNSLEVLHEALDVQAGNKAGILKGPYAAKLNKVPPEAAGVLMGDVPEPVRQNMVPVPFKGVPKSVAAVMTRTKTINIDWQGITADADQAKAFADSVAEMKKMAIDGLQRLPPALKLKPEQVKVLTKALEDIRTEAKEDKVSGGVEVTQKTLEAIHDWIRKGLEESHIR